MKNLAGLAGQTRAGQAIGRVGLAIQRAARKSMRYVTGKCGCFTAMTLVWTANGAVPIVDIEEGQQVLAAPDDGLATSYSSNTVATKIIVGQASLVQLLVLHEDGSSELISTTDEHPFHVADTAKWTRADGLRIGDHLSTITGTAKLQGVLYTTERVPVYNLSIPGSPTYYVGEHGVWVHNSPCDWWNSADIAHIMKPKHAWGEIGVATFDQARPIIESVIQFGTETATRAARGGEGFVHVVEDFIKGEYVEVTYRSVNGVITDVTNAWVKTR